MDPMSAGETEDQQQSIGIDTNNLAHILNANSAEDCLQKCIDNYANCSSSSFAVEFKKCYLYNNNTNANQMSNTDPNYITYSREKKSFLIFFFKNLLKDNFGHCFKL